MVQVVQARVQRASGMANPPRNVASGAKGTRREFNMRHSPVRVALQGQSRVARSESKRSRAQHDRVMTDVAAAFGVARAIGDTKECGRRERTRDRRLSVHDCRMGSSLVQIDGNRIAGLA